MKHKMVESPTLFDVLRYNREEKTHMGTDMQGTSLDNLNADLNVHNVTPLFTGQHSNTQCSPTRVETPTLPVFNKSQISINETSFSKDPDPNKGSTLRDLKKQFLKTARPRKANFAHTLERKTEMGVIKPLNVMKLQNTISHSSRLLSGDYHVN